MNKKVLVPALILGAAVAVGALSYVGATSAAGNGFRGNDEMKSQLAEKLGVEESQVESAIGEMREEKRTLRRAEQEEKLSEAVADGVITEEQKQAIIDHRNETQTDREQRRSENQQWMEDGGIDHDALKEYTGGGEGMGNKSGFGKGMRGM